MRPRRADTMLEIATAMAKRSTCARRQVGCVLTDMFGRVLATGHNGVPRALEHCTNSPCAGLGQKSGEGLDLCHAIHAEANALMFCQEVMKIASCYVTASPCVSCVKMLLNTTCKDIIFIEEYPHHDAKKLWTSAGRNWVQHGQDNP
jgi:dCMP deaminase